MIRVGTLPQNRWRSYRRLRLEALRKDPSAFGSSYEEEKKLPEEVWRKRIKTVLFAMEKDKPLGMVSYVFSDRIKRRHVASIYGVYVKPEHRGEGIGGGLLEAALSEIRKNRGIIKVQLSVNPELRHAVRMYSKAGFLVTGKSRKELKVGDVFYDLISMEKEIRNAV